MCISHTYAVYTVCFYTFRLTHYRAMDAVHLYCCQNTHSHTHTHMHTHAHAHVHTHMHVHTITHTHKHAY
uniref:Uncharacterized protein n=1 Tax=Anguilla anguilla TaxID=7936 RepID=A0A0E9XA25_ANGAN